MQQWTLQQSTPYVIWESALLPDENDSFMYDSALLVQADAEIRLQRVRQRNPGWTAAEIRLVMRVQASDQCYGQHAHALIINQGSTLELEQAVLQQHLTYMSHWSTQ